MSVVAPEIAVIGTGAMGASLAAELERAGLPCLLCARTPRPPIVVERSGYEPVRLERIITDPDGLAPVRWVLLAVKAHQTGSAARWLRALAGPGTTVLVLQNGVGQRELVGPLAPEAEIVPSALWWSAEVLEDGRVTVHLDPRMTLPDDRGGHAIAALLEPAACEVTVSGGYEAAAWRKLMLNAIAGLTVLTGRRMGIFRRPDIAELSRAYAEEILAVATAAGVALPAETPAEIVAFIAQMPAEIGSSITYDREAGLPLEFDARNEVIRRRGREHGVPTPIGDVIVPLLAAASDGW